ncbi:hypothetical protein [Roseateles sp.]|uniref:hypothetical protein n=1 Tax=Roseateles sp. TaxID=1971397 RepID=UPI003BA4E5C0
MAAYFFDRGRSAQRFFGLGLMALSWTLVGSAMAGPADSVQLERQLELQKLSQQRADLDQRFNAESLLCEQRFAVNDCLERARVQRKQALAPVVAREQEIDKLERRERAEAQRLRVIEREREAAAQEAQRRTAELLAEQRRARRVIEDSEARPEPEAIKPKPSAQDLAQSQKAKHLLAEQEAQRRLAQKQAFERRQAQHQREARERQVQREAELKSKKPALTLPIPSAADIAAAGKAGGSAPKAPASAPLR